MKESPTTPEGGYCLVPAMGIVRAWWAYKQGIIELVDVRVWLAGFELVARRCGLQAGRTARYRVEELKALVGGVGSEHSRASVRRLTNAGLLAWSAAQLRMLDGNSIEAMDTAEVFNTKRTLLVNHRRHVPVPRRMLRFMAKSRRPVLLATLLGHLLRCLYHRRTTVRPDGLCKASWVSRVFEVDERNVKSARRFLVGQGLLETGNAPQRVLNRHGLPVRVNLNWRPVVRVRPPPRARISTPQSPPPQRTGNSSFGRSEYQKRRVPASAGVRMPTGRGARLSDVIPMDLGSPERLESLFVQAATRGLVKATESGRLLVLTAATHALRVGRVNPCGLFVSTLRNQRWTYLSQADEDAARHLAVGSGQAGAPVVRAKPGSYLPQSTEHS